MSHLLSDPQALLRSTRLDAVLPAVRKIGSTYRISARARKMWSGSLFETVRSIQRIHYAEPQRGQTRNRFLRTLFISHMGYWIRCNQSHKDGHLHRRLSSVATKAMDACVLVVHVSARSEELTNYRRLAGRVRETFLRLLEVQS
jgi:hypothetical protein